MLLQQFSCLVFCIFLNLFGFPSFTAQFDKVPDQDKGGKSDEKSTSCETYRKCDWSQGKCNEASNAFAGLTHARPQTVHTVASRHENCGKNDQKAESNSFPELFTARFCARIFSKLPRSAPHPSTPVICRVARIAQTVPAKVVLAIQAGHVVAPFVLLDLGSTYGAKFDCTAGTLQPKNLYICILFAGDSLVPLIFAFKANYGVTLGTGNFFGVCTLTPHSSIATCLGAPTSQKVRLFLLLYLEAF